LAGMVAQQRIHQVNAIPHWGIGARNAEGGTEAIGVAAEKVFDNLPIGARGGGPTLLSGCVAINVDIQRGSRAPLLGSG
jgi:hypothetical protein